MATLYSELTAYCQEKELSIPPKADRQILGNLVAVKYRELTSREVPKEPSQETVWVSGYPEEFRETIREIIDSFFKMPAVDLQRMRSQKPQDVKKFNFDIPKDHLAVFETVLVKKGFQVRRNKVSHGKIQYCIHYTDPSQLIYLGMAYFKNIPKTNIKS